MQNYLHNIIARLENPLRIRIGGNSMDISTYVPTLSELLVETDPDAYFNDIPVDFGPVLFDVINAMSDDVGEMQFVLGLTMRNPNDTSNLLLLAAAAEEQLGDRLDAFLLGNEPDLYGLYSIPSYVSAVGEVVEDMRNANDLPTTLLGGPTICCQWNLSTILEDGLVDYSYKYYAVQRYPQENCGGPTPQNTNITYYLSHQNVAPFLGWQQEGMSIARKNNVPVLMTEYNSVSCGGSNISDTFAATLWAIDVAMKGPSMNYSALYLHTREFNVTYNLFDPPTPETSTEPGWSTGSVYYATLFLAEMTDYSGTVIVDLNLNDSNSNPEATVAAYGIYHDSGAARGKLALINFADANDPGESATQVYTIPAGVFDSVFVRILTAPSVVERENISWAGQTVGDIGNLLGTQETTSLNCTAGCNVEVPSPGAALVFNNGSKMYTGNSTIIGTEAVVSSATSTLSILHGLNIVVVLASLYTLCI
ncbi:hypothetical protein H0H92_012642 [Tricholoma furcatifolium]|nr:hypothetical protein H0H92_012642 [Tricholoma furcatifolium]